ncbi:hypothetical protein FH972_025347 [Carpinus fangiana]|uniref:Uncharacterized protein n=1 Tax=Carpinus fangiana TaxID=176857 RepID=A0A5N6L1C9_9ROSI|nr:hypothetical protein FH972_025347 [Carpinus fangiana]
MGLKGFVEGGIASIVAGASTHPLDLIKVEMQLHGKPHLPNPAYRPTLAGSSTGYNMSLHVAPPRIGHVSTCCSTPRWTHLHRLQNRPGRRHGRSLF